LRSYFYNNPVINLAGEAKKNVFIVASSNVACLLQSKSLSKTSCRYYSTSNSDSPSSNLPPVSILTINNLNNEDCVKSSIRLLKGKGGIYSFINTVNHHKYIGSAKDLYLRLNEHLEGKKSNSALQKAFTKYGLNKFKFCIYEYFTYESKIISQKALTDLETSYINKFNFDTLYNFKATATSSLGYIHTKEARLKMVEYYKNKNNHPMFGKTHTKEALALISKPLVS
jgi:predicted GIY-YIG superfamily endonuclease